MIHDDFSLEDIISDFCKNTDNLDNSSLKIIIRWLPKLNDELLDLINL